jgi:2-octaprenyl-6-methoxyphenol hydroxylase
VAEAASGSGAEILIVGAGPVGLTLALLLQRTGRHVRVLDARHADAGADDPRALALAAGSRQLLERVGAWPAQATPIREVHISQQGGGGRTLLEAREHGLTALGHVARYGEVQTSLATAARAAGIAVHYDCAALGVVPSADGARVHTRAGPLAARLVVHAEGAADEAQMARCDYVQDAIVCEATATTAADGRAWERFTPAGPLALLPLGARYAVVYVAARNAAAGALALDDADFVSALNARLGGAPWIASVGPRQRFPLALRVRPRLTRGCEVWIGNAAQTLHPVSGQGLNLGLRDAAELALSLGDDNDPRRALRRFALRRQPDRLLSVAFTDGIVRVFGNDFPPLALARGLGLSLLDLAGPIRRRFADRLMFGTRL